MKATLSDNRVCNGCDKYFRDEDLVTYQRNSDETFAEACRHCITKWVKEIFLWNIPFWARKVELQNNK